MKIIKGKVYDFKNWTGVFHISFNQVKFYETFPLKSAVKNACCLPERCTA
jgi:hypothetical protein